MVVAGYTRYGGRYVGNTAVYLSNGSGTFALAKSYYTQDGGGANNKSYDVSLGDVNGDGITDMVVAGYINDGVKDLGVTAVYLNNGSGSFALAKSYITHNGGASGGYTYSTSLADIDADGVLEMAVTGWYHNGSRLVGSTAIYENNGLDTFSLSRSYASHDGGGGTTNRSSCVTVGDLNGDDRPDLVVAGACDTGSAIDGTLMMYLQDTTKRPRIQTRALALQSIDLLSSRRDYLAVQRGVLGASLSRLDVASHMARSLRDNYERASAAIIDVDAASELALLVSQIRQQAAGAVLAQANVQAHLVTQLLGKSKD